MQGHISLINDSISNGSFKDKTNSSFDYYELQMPEEIFDFKS